MKMEIPHRSKISDALMYQILAVRKSDLHVNAESPSHSAVCDVNGHTCNGEIVKIEAWGANAEILRSLIE